MADLTNKQIAVTRDFYNRCAKDYAEKIEWLPKTRAEILKYNITPLVKYTPKGGSVLLVGCGTGRDYALLTQKGFKCLGIDNSFGMLNEARKRVKGNFLKLDLREIKKLKRKFDAISCESALPHIPEKELDRILQNFKACLTGKGIIYLAVKVGKKGVIQRANFGSKRFFLVYDQKDFKKHLCQNGLKILWQAISKHTLANYPRWYSIICTKD